VGTREREKDFVFEMQANCIHNAVMATLTIRDLPEHLHLRLKERARRNRRSVNQEVIAELIEINFATSDGLAEEKRVQSRAELMIKKAAELREPIKRFLNARQLDSAKREGRA
jgi:plasmid stability protein